MIDHNLFLFPGVRRTLEGSKNQLQINLFAHTHCLQNTLIADTIGAKILPKVSAILKLPLLPNTIVPS